MTVNSTTTGRRKKTHGDALLGAMKHQLGNCPSLLLAEPFRLELKIIRLAVVIRNFLTPLKAAADQAVETPRLPP